MPLNDSKVREIIREEVKSIEERCTGYREELEEAILDIIALERQHRVQKIRIRQKIGARCNATGRWLASNSARGGMDTPDGE